MLLILTALALTACPGYPPLNVSVTATGADAAAYRVGDDSWQVPDDATSFSFYAPGAYEVAVRCGDDTTVVSITKDDTETPDLSCPPAAPPPVSFDVDFDVTAVAGADSAVLYYGDNSMGDPGTAGTFSVTDGVEGEQDLVLVALDAGGDPLAAKMVTETVSAGGSYSITLDPGDTANVATRNVADYSGEVPAGWPAADAIVATVTPRGTLVSGGFVGPGGGPFYTFKFGDHDLMFATALDGSGVQTLVQIATSSAPGEDFTVDLPPPFSVTVSSDTFPTIGGLNLSDAELRLYEFNMGWATKSLDVAVSQGFLAGATSYTLPDLTGLAGFADVTPASGDSVTVRSSVLYASLTISELFDLRTQDSPFALPAGASVRIATDKDTYTAP